MYEKDKKYILEWQKNNPEKASKWRRENQDKYLEIQRKYSRKRNDWLKESRRFRNILL